jgi:CRISPR-associated protein Csd1
MILTKLKDFADEQMTLPPAMYAELKIHYLIDLNLDGTLKGHFIPLGGDTKANKRGNPFTVPFVGRTVGIKPKLLADSAEYVLGIPRPDSKLDRVADCHPKMLGSNPRSKIASYSNILECLATRKISRLFTLWLQN